MSETESQATESMDEPISEDSLPDTTDDEMLTAEQTGMSEMTPPLFVVCFVVFIFAISIISYCFGYQNKEYAAQVEELKAVRTTEDGKEIPDDSNPTDSEADGTKKEVPDHIASKAPMLYSMQQLYELNPDTIGWLSIEDTNIDYPVMQSMYDEEYYLDRDFQKNYNANGCLIMDTDSVVGSGTKENEYTDGSKPSTNMIIHGHNMKSGAMFGNLDMYRTLNYCNDHKIIQFTSLYETREYEIVSVFLSQVYLKTQTDVFKFYQFFEANNEAEFNDFYKNIKELALYDTGVTAEYGDEFITLSVCAYHVENGRLVVVGKRIK